MKTNIRLEAKLIEECRRLSDGNLNRFIRTALTEWVRIAELGRLKLPSWQLPYVAHIRKDAEGLDVYESPKVMLTVRLHSVDVNLIKLNGYDLTRALRCALLQKIKTMGVC